MNPMNSSAITVCIAVVLAGCAGPSNVDREYGKSYAAMIERQTLNPDAGKTPAADSAGADGQRLQKAIEVYRTDVAKGTSEVKQDIVINVGK